MSKLPCKLSQSDSIKNTKRHDWFNQWFNVNFYSQPSVFEVSQKIDQKCATSFGNSFSCSLQHKNSGLQDVGIP